MATPGLIPVVGTTPLRVSDGQARSDPRSPRQAPRTGRKQMAAPDSDLDGEAADSYTHDESTGDDADRAEQVRRLLERAMARVEHPAGSSPLEPNAPPTPIVPVSPVTIAPPAVDLTARYRSGVVTDPPPHAIDRIG